MFATLVGTLPRPPGGDDPLRARLAAQLEAGLDLLSFAEPERPDEDLVRSWAQAAAIAAELGEAPVKAAILGPYSTDEGHPSERAIARARATIDALFAAGCPFVEVHEPAAVGIGEDAAARRAFAETQGALAMGVDGHLCLAIVGGNADTAGRETILGAPYASFLFDLIAGPDNWRLVVPAPPSAGIVVGALDVRPEVREVPETVVWAAHYAASTGGRGLDRVGVATAASLGPFEWTHAVERMKLLGRSARIADLPRGETLARALDPRTLDLRSAAAGRYAPRRRPAVRERAKDADSAPGER